MKAETGVLRGKLGVDPEGGVRYKNAALLLGRAAARGRSAIFWRAIRRAGESGLETGSDAGH